MTSWPWVKVMDKGQHQLRSDRSMERTAQWGRHRSLLMHVVFQTPGTRARCDRDLLDCSANDCASACLHRAVQLTVARALRSSEPAGIGVLPGAQDARAA